MDRFALVAIFASALASTLLNMLLPLREFLKALGFPGPAGGMALLGGFIFTFWIVLAHLASGCRRLTALSTALLIPAFSLLVSPWYGVVDPPWFGVYGIIAFAFAGLVVELACRRGVDLKALVLGGGFSNTLCLAVTLLAIGLHTSIWPPSWFAPISLLSAFTSGALGSLLALALRRAWPTHE
ncbi:MAG: hypothetical protein DRJ68_03000 [Thermoprotei archaeon]|nr:MAG: hypothetical protein DRJ68_03000 [Thermoprotei archaeon]